MARDLMRTSPSSVCASTRQTEDAMRHDLLILSGRLLRPVVSRLSLRSSTSAAEPPVDTKTALAAPAVAKPASDAGDQDPAAVAAAQAKANAVAVALAGPPRPPGSDDGVPAFDIARIEPTGEAVIAGRATPGATVELLRNGELHGHPSTV